MNVSLANFVLLVFPLLFPTPFLVLHCHSQVIFVDKYKSLWVIDLGKYYSLPRPCSQEVQYLPVARKVHVVLSDLHSKYPNENGGKLRHTKKHLEGLDTCKASDGSHVPLPNNWPMIEWNICFLFIAEVPSACSDGFTTSYAGPARSRLVNLRNVVTQWTE